MIDLKEIDTLDKALWALIYSSSSDMIGDWKNCAEEEMFQYHHGFGTWIRNEFGLWADGKLVKYFNSIGIYHADDMSGIILTSLHRSLHCRDIKLQDQVKYYRDFWAVSDIDPDTMLQNK
jgi:hypothetical protein